MKFSKTTGCFYPNDILYTNPPDDLIEVPQADFDTAMARPAGSTLTVEDGQLVIVPAPIPSAEELLAQAQVAQGAQIDAACATAITAGFSSAALGQDYHYPSKLTDQANLNANVVASLMPNLPADWTTEQICADENGNWAYLPHTAAQIQRVGNDCKTAILGFLSKNAKLQALIAEASTVEVVQSFNW